MPETRRQRHSRAARERILAAARGLMLEEGPSGVTIREIARRSGFGAASLYTYFAGRDDLVRALLDESLRRLIERLDAVREGTGRGLLVGRAMAVWDFARDEPADFDAVITAGARDLLRDADQAALGGTLARFAEPLAEARRAGARGPDPATATVGEAAWSLWALAVGVALLGDADDVGTGRARERARRILARHVEEITR